MKEIPERGESPRKSDRSHARFDERSRRAKAAKIMAILNAFTDLGKAAVLDIGTGSGHIIADIAKWCDSATSVDLCDERVITQGYSFKMVDGPRLPFDDASFDVVISNHVIEHVPDQKLHLAEVHRALKKEGVLYLATPNRWWWKDPHHEMPFITWLPRSRAMSIFRRIRGREWDIHPLSFWKVKKLAAPLFVINHVTPLVLHEPERFSLDMMKGLHPFLGRIPMPLQRLLSLLLPTYLFVMKKR